VWKASDLLQPFGPRLLSVREARLDVLGLLEASEHLLVEGVLLPGPDPVTILRHQGATDGGVQGGQPVSRGQKTLPRLQDGAVQRTWGRGAKKLKCEMWNVLCASEIILITGNYLDDGQHFNLTYISTICYHKKETVAVVKRCGSNPTVLTGLHHWLPLVAPLTELLGVLPLHTSSLLETRHDVIAGLEGVFCSLHRGMEVPRLPGHKERGRSTVK